VSYCRWSSDSCRCDLYCYEDASGGYTTHVATARYTGDAPTMSPFPADPSKVVAWMEEYKDFHKALDGCERVMIGGPYDGQTFNDPDLRSFRTRLLHLREVGYNFPDHVLEDVDVEIEDQDAETGPTKAG
jgi:hypothetical protein